MPEWAPGVLAGLLKEIGNTGRVHQRAGLLKIAAAIEALAKAKLGQTSHQAGTPSPASRGGPPSLVTGTGRRSIGHESVISLDEILVKVGTLAGIFPPAVTAHTSKGTRSRQSAGTGGKRGTTASSKYLLYQETLERFGHPFLKPAYLQVVKEDSVAIWLSSFRTWPKI